MTIFDLIRYPITIEFKEEDLDRIPIVILEKWLSKLGLQNPALSFYLAGGESNHREFSKNQLNLALGLLRDIIEEHTD